MRQMCAKRKKLKQETYENKHVLFGQKNPATIILSIPLMKYYCQRTKNSLISCIV